MDTPKIVIDTNVLVSGLRSNTGAAFRLLQLVGSAQFDINLSVPLVMEYEEVLLRLLPTLPISKNAVTDIIDYHCAIAQHHRIYFLWRPYLPDPKDDMILELSVKAGCEYIVTYNQRAFRGVERFGIRAVTPYAFLREIGDLS